MDESGNDNHATTPGTSPDYETSGPNGLPSVSFNGGNSEYMQMTNFSYGSLNAGEIFVVVRASNDPATNDNRAALWDFGSETDNEKYVESGSANIEEEFGTTVRKEGGYDPTENLTNWHIYNVVSEAGNYEARINGAAPIIDLTSNTVGFTAQPRLGRADGNSSAYFSGEVAELIMYNQGLNSAQRVIVTNYLASKYRISITKDRNFLDVNHGHDLAGIGQETTTDFHTTAMSADILKISSPSDLENGEYLTFAHNNRDITTWSNFEAPVSWRDLLLDREWRVDEFGDVGTVSITVDFSNLPTPTSGYPFYYIYTDVDGDFSSGATVYPLRDIGNNQFSVDNINLDDQVYLKIGISRNGVGFNTSFASISEINSPAQNSLDLILPLADDLDVYLSVLSATATPDDDFVLADTVINIPAGQTQGTVSFTIINDIIVEGSEQITYKIDSLSLSGLFVRSGTGLDRFQLNITDDDDSRKLDFNVNNAIVNEDTGAIDIQIDLNVADLINPTTVDYFFKSGTALDTFDVFNTAGTVTLNPGETSKTFTININEDLLDENDETFIIELTNPTNANVSTDFQYSVTIIDNDDAPVASFNSTSGSASESIGLGSIVVNLSAPAGQDIKIGLAVSDCTATQGDDYNLALDSLTIPAGQSSATITPTILEDVDEEGSESFVVVLTGAVGATLGSDSIFTFTIADNDGAGFTGPGGVGDENTIETWLRADILTQNDGENVNTWPDYTLNGFDATTPGTSPDFETSFTNGLPSVNFNGGNSEYVQFGNLSFLNEGEVYVALRAASDNPGNDNRAALWDFGSETDNEKFPEAGSVNIEEEFGTTVRKEGINKSSYNLEIPRVYSVQSSPNEYIVRIDGDTLLRTITNSVGFTTAPRIGRADGNSSAYFSGDIGEFVLYNQKLNGAQKKIVDNYFSTKFDLAISNDLYSLDNTHDKDLAGIGQDENSMNQHLEAQSGGLLKISSPSDIDPFEYMLFAHQGGDTSTWTTTEVQSSLGDVQRLAIEWWVDVSGGDLGTVTLAIDTSNLPASPTGYNNYLILVDDNGIFTSGCTAYELQQGAGSYYEVSGVDLNDLDYISIGVRRTEVQFTSTTSNTFEPNGPAQIEVSLSRALASPVIVDYSILSSTAGSGTDFVLVSPGQITIPAGNTTANISIPLINDTELESDENIILQLTGASNGVVVGTNSQHDFQLSDDDNLRKISFASATASANESDGSATITIIQAIADPSFASTVNYTVTGGSATNGADYILANGVATIANNTTSTTINVTINDDFVAEGDETFIVTLSSPTNANLASSNTELTFTIIDDETTPEVNFQDTLVYIYENTTPGVVEINLGTSVGSDVTIDYTVTDGTAQGAGVDYILSSGTLVIPAGNSVGYLYPQIFNDSEVELDEEFTITITGATGISIGTSLTATFVIFDDDRFGFTGPGGVGDKNVINRWLDAEALGLGNNSNVGTWTDVSGNGNNAAGVSNGGNYRTVGNSSFARAASVAMNGSNDYYDLGSYSSFVTAEAYILTNLDASDPADNREGLWDFGTSGNDTRFPDNNGQIDEIFGRNSRADNVAFTGDLGNTAVYNARSTSGDWGLRLNGSQIASSSSVTVDFPGAATLGKSNGNVYLDGQIGEFVLYTDILNTTQRKIVDNYMAAKYDAVVANDMYTADMTHGHYLAGIGKESSTDYHLQAQSGGILTVAYPTDLEDGEYFFFGHNDSSIATFTSVEAPSASSRRLLREWKVEEFGGDGLESVVFFLDTTLLPARPTEYQTYALMVDADGDFTSGVSFYLMRYFGGSLFIADNVDVGDGEFISIAAIQNITLADGDFNDPSNWLAGVVPFTTQAAIIGNGHDITLSQNITVGSIELSDNSSLDLQGNKLTLDQGCITLASTSSIDISNATSTIR